jgi:ABC-type taurine transport system ATPase subunit
LKNVAFALELRFISKVFREKFNSKETTIKVELKKGTNLKYRIEMSIGTLMFQVGKNLI